MQRIIFLFSLLLLFAQQATTQPIWQMPEGKHTFLLEALKPDFEGEDNTTFLTSAWFLNYRYAFNSNLALKIDLPFAHFGTEAQRGFGSTSGNRLGNPYVGIEISNAQKTLFASLGLRPPLISDLDLDEGSGAAAFVGLTTEYIDRMEAYLPDVLSLIGTVDFKIESPDGFVAMAHTGAWTWIDAGDQQDESEFGVLYGAYLGYAGNAVRLYGGLAGRWILTEEGDFGENTLHELRFRASFAGGNVRPMLQLRLPLDEDYKDVLDSVIGVGLEIYVPPRQ